LGQISFYFLKIEGITMINADIIKVNWHPGLSIYASERFLQAVGDDYGWIGGIDDQGKLLCILPYSIINKASIRFCRFRIETIKLTDNFGIEQEKHFLNSVIKLLMTLKIDVILPPSTNTVFRCFPEGSIAAPYSTWILDLDNNLEQLWHNISAKYRKEIKRAMESDIEIREGIDQLDIAYEIIKKSFSRSNIHFMSRKSFSRIIKGLGEYSRILVAYKNNKPQSCTAYHFSKYCAYAVHGGSTDSAVLGAMKLLQWHAINLFKSEGIRYFDFLGARVNPESGSKQEGIMLFKKYFGAKPKYGFIWKCPISKFKYSLYQIGIRLLRGGDIIDNEKKKLNYLLDTYNP